MIKSIMIYETKNKNQNIKRTNSHISFSGLKLNKISNEIANSNQFKNTGIKLNGLVDKIVKKARNVFKKTNKNSFPFVEKPILTPMGEDARAKRIADLLEKVSGVGDSWLEMKMKQYIKTYGAYPPKSYLKDLVEDANVSDKDRDSLMRKISFLGRRGNGIERYNEIEKIQNNPWLTDDEKSEEIQKILKGTNIETIIPNQHSQQIDFNGDDEIKKIKDSPWLTDDEKTKEIAEIKHNDIDPDSIIDDVSHQEDILDNDHHGISSSDDNTDNLPERPEEHESFFKKLFDSIFDRNDDNIDT